MRPTSNTPRTLRTAAPLAVIALALTLMSIMALPVGPARAASPRAQAGVAHRRSCPDFQAANIPSVWSMRVTGVSCGAAHRIAVSFLTDTRCYNATPCVEHGLWCRETYGGGDENSGDSSFYVACRVGARHVHFAHGI